MQCLILIMDSIPKWQMEILSCALEKVQLPEDAFSSVCEILFGQIISDTYVRIKWRGRGE